MSQKKNRMFSLYCCKCNRKLNKSILIPRRANQRTIIEAIRLAGSALCEDCKKLPIKVISSPEADLFSIMSREVLLKHKLYEKDVTKGDLDSAKQHFKEYNKQFTAISYIFFRV